MNEWRSFTSEALDESVSYRVIEGSGDGQRLLVYLLHGRGDTVDSWDPVLDDLRGLPVTAVMLDAPWNSRGSYYVDSVYSHGHAVETAIARDLIAEFETRLEDAVDRHRRVVAGYSMGGFGAVRLAFAHPELFGAAVALSPAVYVPAPPAGSSAREFGAFGREAVAFETERFRELNYPALLERYPPGLGLNLAVAVGDAEPAHPGSPVSASMEAQANALVAAARDIRGVRATLRTYPGGHDFGVWGPALTDALRDILSAADGG
jgi:S-formylglutathione hydrolase FrmB